MSEGDHSRVARQPRCRQRASSHRCRPIQQPQAAQHRRLAARLGEIEAAVALTQSGTSCGSIGRARRPPAWSRAGLDELTGDQDRTRRRVRLEACGDQKGKPVRAWALRPSPAISMKPASPPKRSLS